MAILQTEKYHRYQRYFVEVGHFYREKKVRVYTGIVFSILTIAFFIFFAIRPTLVTIASLLKEIKDKKEIVAKLEDKINNLNLAQIEYQKIEKNLYLLDEALPTNSKLSQFTRQLEVVARKNNVLVDSIQYGKTPLKTEESNLKTTEINQDTEKGKIMKGADFSLAVAGDYQQLKSFFDTLINLRRFISADSVAFTADPERKKLILEIEAKAHYFTKEQ